MKNLYIFFFFFFRSSNPTCLYNKPNPGDTIPRFLPGKLMDANEQCQKLYGGRADVVDDTICTALHCTDPDDPYTVKWSTAAAEGTKCGEGKICLHGQCLNEHTLIK